MKRIWLFLPILLCGACRQPEHKSTVQEYDYISIVEQTEIVELEGEILPIYYAPVAGAEMVTKVNLETDRKFRYRLNLEENMVHEHVRRNPLQWLKHKITVVGG